MLQLWSEPALRQTLADHIVSLHLTGGLESDQQLVDICNLTRLTWLSLRLEGCPMQNDIGSALARLQSLSFLQLKGSGSFSGAPTLASVDLSALTRLTCIALQSLQGSFAVAATATNLRELYVHYPEDSPDRQALAAMSALTALQKLTLGSADLRHVLGMLWKLPNLNTLELDSIKGQEFLDRSLNSFPGGSEGFCRALGRLTRLTSLNISFIECAPRSGCTTGLPTHSYVCLAYLYMGRHQLCLHWLCAQVTCCSTCYHSSPVHHKRDRGNTTCLTYMVCC